MDASEVRLVVVDDEVDFAEALTLLLKHDGYTVRIATNCEDALALVADFDPVCVLTDINMAACDGIELAAHLRAQYGREIALVAVTAWGQADERVSEKFAQFDHYLRKPVDTNELGKIFQPL